LELLERMGQVNLLYILSLHSVKGEDKGKLYLMESKQENKKSICSKLVLLIKKILFGMNFQWIRIFK
jgi:hypothetical protein